MRWVAWIWPIVGVALCSCATSGGSPQSARDEVVVAVDTAAFAGTERPPRAHVEVTDIRREATMERTALGVSLGRIRLDPPVPELVRAAVQAAVDEVLEKSGLTAQPVVLCGIRRFNVATPSTPLYWDIDVEIEIVVRVGDRDRTVTADATDRTWLWPSEELIGSVTTVGLGRLVTQTREALGALLATP